VAGSLQAAAVAYGLIQPTSESIAPLPDAARIESAVQASTSAHRPTPRTVYPLIAAAILGVLILDRFTTLGIAAWVLYLVPIALCVTIPDPRAPLLVAAAATVATIAGAMLSPAGAIPTEIAHTNRALGAVAFWSVAVILVVLAHVRLRADRLAWLQRGSAQLSQAMLGDRSPAALADVVLADLARTLHAGVGALYLRDGEQLVRTGSFAASHDALPARRALGEDLAGQSARDNRPFLLQPVPASFLQVTTPLGTMPPAAALVLPITHDGRVTGVLELGLLPGGPAVDDVRELTARVAGDIGLALRSAQDRQQLQALLAQTQRQAEELETQQDELRAANAQLEEQSDALRQSQARLEAQQAELEETNAQLEGQAQLLEEQKDALRAKAVEIERASRYKSEFLANMSHELRTPLNSSMILAQVLAENRDGSLSEQQVRHAQIILASNRDLLALINDILDLSKVEAGRVDLDITSATVRQIVDPVAAALAPLAERKSLRFVTQIDPALTAPLLTDVLRVQQVLKNLLSNAIKFTDSGHVMLRVLPEDDTHLRFEVIDTGVGIASDQQALIFEAFRQADGTASRRFGGTGLGLSISRQLAALLHGEVGVRSAPGKGSTFWFRLPLQFAAAAGAPAPDDDEQLLATRAPLPPPAEPPAPAALPAPSPSDDVVGQDARGILIVEDDAAFAGALSQLCRDAGFHPRIAGTATEAIHLARQHLPAAVLLDIELPDVSGLTVLDSLMHDPATRHLPVHVLSVADHGHDARDLGAIGFVRKPASTDELRAMLDGLRHRLAQPLRRVLVVSADSAQRDALAELLGWEDVEVIAAEGQASALQCLHAHTVDCMVLDLQLADGSAFGLLDAMAAGEAVAFPPVIVHAAQPLGDDDTRRLRGYARALVIRDVKSQARLLDEATLFLHQVESRLPPSRRRALQEVRRRDAAFEGRTLLLAEDDVRNVFSLTSVFEPLGARLLIARNGAEAVTAVEQHPEIALVLMDIMMPEVDGITAMERIRAQPRFAQLPIIALTAAARPEDRRRCLDAGASDYVAKPIDVDRLVSLCRVWLPR
jgi:signal transduction histidine kinase/CheY-like chemotaxis protein